MGAGNAAAAAFSPSNLSGLKFWMNDSSYSGSDGAAIATVTDLSSDTRNLTQSSATLRPLLKTNIQNGRQILRFDGSNDLMTWSNTISGLTSFTYCFAAKFTVSGQQVIHTAFEGPEAYIGTGWFVAKRDVAVPISNIGSVNGLWRVSIIRYDNASGNWVVRVNGSTAGSGTNATSFNGAIEKFMGDYHGCCGGDVGEVCIYNSDIGSTNTTSIETYLNTRWAIY